MRNERDSHFQGFATLLWDEVEAAIRNNPGFIPEGESLRIQFLPAIHTIIARRAYDLAVHVFQQSIPDYQQDIFPSITDLTAWPESEEH